MESACTNELCPYFDSGYVECFPISLLNQQPDGANDKCGYRDIKLNDCVVQFAETASCCRVEGEEQAHNHAENYAKLVRVPFCSVDILSLFFLFLSVSEYDNATERQNHTSDLEAVQSFS